MYVFGGNHDSLCHRREMSIVGQSRVQVTLGCFNIVSELEFKQVCQSSPGV